MGLFSFSGVKNGVLAGLMRPSPLAILNVLIVRREHAGLLSVARRLRLAGVHRHLI